MNNPLIEQVEIRRERNGIPSRAATTSSKDGPDNLIIWSMRHDALIDEQIT